MAKQCMSSPTMYGFEEESCFVFVICRGLELEGLIVCGPTFVPYMATWFVELIA